MLRRKRSVLGTEVVGGEVIGLIPRKAVEMATGHSVEIPGFQADIVLEDRLELFAFSTPRCHSARQTPFLRASGPERRARITPWRFESYETLAVPTAAPRDK